MLRLEEYVFQLGNWNSLSELEEHVSLEELHRLFWARQRQEYKEKAFQAALKGVELPPFDDPDLKDAPTFDDIKERVKRRHMETFGKSASNDENDIESMFDMTIDD